MRDPILIWFESVWFLEAPRRHEYGWDDRRGGLTFQVPRS